MSGANLSGSYYNDSFQRNTNLKNVNLTDANLTGAIYNSKTRGLTDKQKEVMKFQESDSQKQVMV